MIGPPVARVFESYDLLLCSSAALLLLAVLLHPAGSSCYARPVQSSLSPVGLCLLVGLGCGGAKVDAAADTKLDAGADESPEATAEKRTPEPAGDRALRLLARANTFAGTPGADSVDQADWPSIVLATGLASSEGVAALFDDDELFGEPPKAMAKLVETIATVDYDAEGKRAAQAYAELWKGSEHCTGIPKREPLLDEVPQAVEDALSPALAKRLAVIRTGTAFEVTCDAGTGVLVLDASGTVVAMDPLRASDDDELTLPADNRFTDYMNQPYEE